MSRLGEPFELRELNLRNRIVMSPMCQYMVEAEDGIPTDWHFVHYSSRAIGGAGLIIIEATAIEPDGRISRNDLGLWSDEHIPHFRNIIDNLHRFGAKVAVQIAHAGRKAQDAVPPVAPSPIPFGEGYRAPRELATDEVRALADKYAQAARRAVEAGADAVELHGAHGYLIHQFHSALTNRRTDEYGKDRTRFAVEAIRAVKAVLPEGMPLLMRISAVEYAEGGYGVEDAIAFCRVYRDAGVDMFDISSGGEHPKGAPRPYPGYQVPYARAIREHVGVPVIAVGLLDQPALAEHVLASGSADLVAVGRGMLRNPYWAIDALRALGDPAPVVKPYLRGY